MGPILAIALATFTEARRNKILYSTLFFAVVILFNAVLFTEVTIHSYDRILRDVGLGAIGIFGVLIAIFLSVNMVNREIDRRTIYTVVTKPIRRGQFVLGKALGVMVTLAVTLGIMFLAFLAELALYRSPIEPQIFVATLGIFVELMVVTAFGVFTSTFTTPALSAFFCGGFYVLGHVSHDLRYFASKSASELVRRAGEWIYLVLPDLERLNYRVEATHTLAVSGSQLAYHVGYGLAWTVCFLALATAVFARRDFR